MALISHQIALSIGDAADSSRLAFSRQGEDTSLSVVSTQFPDYLTGSLSLPADGRVVGLPTGALQSVRGFYLELLGGGVLMQINGPSTLPGALTVGDPGVCLVRPAGVSPTGDALAAHVYQDSTISRIYLASADAKVVTGAFALWGFAGLQA
jgi:hypothetical protein